MTKTTEKRFDPNSGGFLPVHRYTRPTGEKVIVFRAGRTVVVTIDGFEARRDVMEPGRSNPWLWASEYERHDRESYEALYDKELGR